ncbi:bifunctional 3-(3-hydroxy-phenyl)propionate/3-hydroxycinnamic acid hydroxylase [Nocardioides sp. NPDC126508]
MSESIARPDTYDVVVVGAGPVGLAAARLLSLSDVSVAVVDPQRIVCHHPRATHIDDETMRTFQTLGVADFEPSYLRQAGWEMRDGDGRKFLQLTMPAAESDQGWFTDYQTHQPDVESRLRGLLHRADNASLWLGWVVTDLEQDDAGVTLQLLDKVSEERHTITAAYVIGADGANSFVRSAMSMDVLDMDGTATSLIIDVETFAHPETLPAADGFVLCAEDLPMVYCPIFPGHLRFEFLLSDQHDIHVMERPDTVYDLLSPYLEPGSYRITRSGAYTWHAKLVQGWRKGRVLLAGDAAHLMPPMLGQGMCSGVRDAMNLAWKLAMVVKGEASEALLDTYESERSAAVTPYILESARQSNMILAVSRGHVPPTVDEPQVIERFRPLLGPGLAPVAEDPASAAGQLAPQPRGRDGSRLDDATGYRFTIVGSATVIERVDDETRSLWKRLDVATVTETGAAVDAWLAANEATIAIVRPDHYAYALAADAAGLIESTRSLADSLMAGVSA